MNAQVAAAAPTSAETLSFLKSPAAFGLKTGAVELRETHISWVFLTPEFAYKVKKPVRYEFLDFSTPEKRCFACQEELRLNRRLAPRVYLEVTPLVRTDSGALALGGNGTPVDYLVKMRRLPDDRMLDASLRAGRVTPGDIDRVARDVLPFYLQSPATGRQPADYVAHIDQHVRANFAELARPEHGLSQTLVRRVHGRQLQLLGIFPSLFAQRAERGRVIDGHGDLRPEHVCLTDPTAVFDCLEFSAELREIDVVDELAFLAMECHALAAPWVGQQLLERYRTASGDAFPPALWAFYQAYRACVRAKVAALRAGQLSGTARTAALCSTREYLHLADVLSRSLGPPPLIVVRGLSGTGKSTLATALARGLGAEPISTDAVRRELFGASETPASLNAGRYRPDLRDRVYEELLLHAGEHLRHGLAVVLDGTFLSTTRRAATRALAELHRTPWLMVHCQCPPAVARQRITARLHAGANASEARPDIYEAQRAAAEPDPPGAPALVVDTTAPLAVQQATVYAALRTLEPYQGS